MGKVTGNNAITWMPSVHDWYETVKLNYGHDFSKGRDTTHLPAVHASLEEVPRTWRTMDSILDYWQSFGVDGFRCDMAHMIPMEFWRWQVKRCRDRNEEVYTSAFRTFRFGNESTLYAHCSVEVCLDKDACRRTCFRPACGA